jgi:hypothetical protein
MEMQLSSKKIWRQIMHTSNAGAHDNLGTNFGHQQQRHAHGHSEATFSVDFGGGDYNLMCTTKPQILEALSLFWLRSQDLRRQAYTLAMRSVLAALQARECCAIADRSAKGRIPAGSGVQEQQRLAFSNRVQASFFTAAARGFKQHSEMLYRLDAMRRQTASSASTDRPPLSNGIAARERLQSRSAHTYVDYHPLANGAIIGRKLIVL